MLSSISQRPHVIRWLFPFDIAKVQHFRGALSVSVRFSPQRASFGWICPLESIKCYKSMPNCSATYFTATGGSSLSRGLTPSMASSSLWRDSHLCKVFTDTPAAMANWALVIAIICSKFKCLRLNLPRKTQVSAMVNAGICITQRRYLRRPMKVSAMRDENFQGDRVTLIYI